MAEIARQTSSINGLEAAYTAASPGGDTFDADRRTVLHIKNGGASDITVTIASQVSSAPAGTTPEDKPIVVTAGEERFIGPFDNAYINSDGEAELSYSATTSVTVAVVRV